MTTTMRIKGPKGPQPQGGASRRDVLGLLGAGVALAAAGPAGRAFASENINYMCWEGYNHPTILEPFQAEHGVTFSTDVIVDSAGGFAKLAAGGYREFDLFSCDSPWIQRMGPAGFCRYIDDADFAEQYEDFYPQFRAPFEPLRHDGKTTGLPSRWGWIGPTLNTKFEDPDKWTSYAPILDEAYRDKFCLLDWGDWPILPLALHVGIDPYQELDQHALDEVRKVLRAAFRNTRAIVGDLAIAQRGLLDGSFRVLIGTGTYTTSALRNAGHDYILSIVPEERHGLKQGIAWLEATGLVDNGKNSQAAAEFMKYLVSPEVAVRLAFTEATCNIPATAKAEELLTEEQRSVLQLDYAWHAWDNSVFHNVAPNIDDMLTIWQEELAAR